MTAATLEPEHQGEWLRSRARVQLDSVRTLLQKLKLHLLQANKSAVVVRLRLAG